MKHYLRLAIAIIVCAGIKSAQCAQARDNQPDLSAVDTIMAQALAEHQLPGAVIVVGYKGRIILRRAYGQRSLEPMREPMTVDTVFDMASLTKPLITATAVMQLLEQGLVRLEDPVAKYIPAFAASGKDSITIANLLTHYSGLAPDLDLTTDWQGEEAAFGLADVSHPVTPPAVAFRYSDINFIVLQQLIETLTHTSLNTYAQASILAPLGMHHSRFLPPADWISNIAPTEYDEHHAMLRGVVHDPTARRMGGVAGDAGFFSTADDVALLAQALLDRLHGRDSTFPLTQLSLSKMTRPAQPANGTALRGLGWDIDSPYSGNRGELFPVGSFGHTGFTGTSLWIDPFSDSYVIILANGVHPHAGHPLTSLRGKIATAVAAGLHIDSTSRLPELTGYNESMVGRCLYENRNGHVLTGIDMLEKSHFSTLAELTRAHGGHLRTALLTNQTGMDAGGRSTADVLLHDAPAAAPGFSLVTLFSPEHGIRGALDQENIQSDVDHATGLPVISLYGAGEANHRPGREQLNNLDALIIDLQDAGVRFYTYETLVGYFLELASETGTEIIVLDRPNPVNGAFVQGPLSDAHNESYTNYMPLPVRHGLTLGELAGYFRGERHLNVRLSVVKMEGWQRGDWFDSTGLQWINPSPNLRSLAEATLYPGVALLETTNVSVGRGTDTPFEQMGAPWIDGRMLAQELNARMLPGIRFMPVDFTPGGPYPYAGQLCHGVSLLVTDRSVLDVPEMGLELIAVLGAKYSGTFQIGQANRLLVHKASINALQRGVDPQTIAAQWQAEIEAFLTRRTPYLLY